MKNYEQPQLNIRMLSPREGLCNGSGDIENGVDWNEGNDPQAGV